MKYAEVKLINFFKNYIISYLCFTLKLCQGAAVLTCANKIIYVLHIV